MAQILTSIPVECNLFRTCIGTVARINQEHTSMSHNEASNRDDVAKSGSVGSTNGVDVNDIASLLKTNDAFEEESPTSPGRKRVRLLLSLILKADNWSTQSLHTRRPEYFVGTPWFDDEFRSKLLSDFQTHLFCQAHVRVNWEQMLLTIIENHHLVITHSPSLYFIRHIVADPILLARAQRSTILKLRNMLLSVYTTDQPSGCVGESFHRAALEHATANLDVNYFARHRRLVAVAQSRLFMTHACHVPEDAVLEIMQFLGASTLPVRIETVDSNAVVGESVVMAPNSVFSSVGTVCLRPSKIPTPVGDCLVSMSDEQQLRSMNTDGTHEVFWSTSAAQCTLCTVSQKCSNCERAPRASHCRDHPRTFESSSGVSQSSRKRQRHSA